MLLTQFILAIISCLPIHYAYGNLSNTNISHTQRDQVTGDRDPTDTPIIISNSSVPSRGNLITSRIDSFHGLSVSHTSMTSS